MGKKGMAADGSAVTRDIIAFSIVGEVRAKILKERIEEN